MILLNGEYMLSRKRIINLIFWLIVCQALLFFFPDPLNHNTNVSATNDSGPRSNNSIQSAALKYIQQNYYNITYDEVENFNLYIDEGKEEGNIVVIDRYGDNGNIFDFNFTKVNDEWVLVPNRIVYNVKK